MSNQFSLYIPTLKVSYDADRLIYVFWKFNLGKVDRVDFVPIMISVKGKTEPEEDKRFKQAFIYLDTKSNWHPDIIKSIEEGKAYKFYPNREERIEEFRDDSYWLLLKNKNPVPYAKTTLNIHQLAHNNGLLETKVSEMEEEILKMKLEMERIQVENDKMYRQLTGDEVRTRCDSHSTTESEAEAFVNSWENILRMAEEQGGIYSDENGNYEEHIREQMYSVTSYEDDDNDGREREEDLVYDDSGEMTPRGRVVKKDINAMLGVDGYNNGDVAPRGWKLSKEVNLEVCSECGFKGELVAYGWRNPDDNLCHDCIKLPGMDAYEC